MKDGTQEFRDKTADINDEISDKIDDMIADKTGSNVEVTSFIDARNTTVSNVQFVITTPSIHVVTATEEEPVEEAHTSLKEKIRDLFHK